jgi:ubiquinone/menaquinone biosynthesis C-methylase UbiE
MDVEAQVASHYTSQRLEQAILRGIAAAGKDTNQLTAYDFAGLDEFHVGGIEATKELAAQMELRPGMRLLDVGCGIGGPARFLAAEYGCKVDGVDLTAEFIEVGKFLTNMVKLDPLVAFTQTSALALPFQPATFDGAYMIHVGMNIADKAGIYREVRRVLKDGSLFTIFDVLRTKDGPIHYPMPWALTPETSFVAETADYRETLESAGFHIVKERRRGAFSVQFTERMMAQMKQSGPPALGLHLLMGEKTPVMLKNILAAMRDDVLEPVELFARAV